VDSPYLTAIFPDDELRRLRIRARGPVNIAATNGVAAHEQGLASSQVSTSFQAGGALVLAVVTAVNNANTVADGSDHAAAPLGGLARGRPSAAVEQAVALADALLEAARAEADATRP
jgi:hypothetical protein